MFAVPYETGKTSGISCSSCGAVSCLKVLPDGSLAMLPVPPKSSSGKLLAEVLRLPGVTGISLWGLAQGRGLDREMTNSLGMRMRLIGPGCFQMGSEGGADAEKIVHPVTISRPFYLGVVPVTQGQFERLMGGNPSRFKGENRPVEMVSWVHADEFCRFLADKEGYSYRLPTEAEWEYACRAGTPTDYYWGEEIDPDFCWYKQTSNDQTRNVGQLRPNGWGLYDMSGNVWEWCMDRYGEYSYEAQVDPTGAKAGENRVIRGGAWNQFPPQCRSSYRNGSAPGKGAPFIGFRVVMIPPLPDITGTALRRPPGGNG
jgi:formylglycine-generating enzyme required for sulfatase activity